MVEPHKMRLSYFPNLINMLWVFIIFYTYTFTTRKLSGAYQCHAPDFEKHCNRVDKLGDSKDIYYPKTDAEISHFDS